MKDKAVLQSKPKHKRIISSLYFMLLMHELKNTLHPICQMIECLHRSGCDTQVLNHLQIIERLVYQIQRIPSLMEELALHHQYYSILQNNIQEINLLGLTQQLVIRHFKQSVDKIQFIYTDDSYPLKVKQYKIIDGTAYNAPSTNTLCDKKYIEYLILNLLQNASKYANTNNRIFIHFHSSNTQRIQDQKSTVRIAISNNCDFAGFELVQKILKTNRNTNSNYFNTRQHMGLMLCNKILHLHGSCLKSYWNKERERITMYFVL